MVDTKTWPDRNITKQFLMKCGAAEQFILTKRIGGKGIKKGGYLKYAIPSRIHSIIENKEVMIYKSDEKFFVSHLNNVMSSVMISGESQSTGTTISFIATSYLRLPLAFNGLCIREASQEEEATALIGKATEKNLPSVHKVYLLDCNSLNYFIVAHDIQIKTNENELES